jgi:hypothetical protein
MRQTYEKVMQLELISLGLSIILGFIALLQGSVLVILISFYFLAVSLLCDAYSHQYTTHRQLQGGKQIARACILVILSTALIFHL